MADPLDDGIKFFNSGQYFEAHEAWEDLWRSEHGPLRPFYQGLVQAAVAMHHRSRGNTSGTRAQLLKSLAKLSQYPPDTAGIDVASLRQDLRQILDGRAVEGTGEVRIIRLKTKSIVVESDGTS